MLKKQYIKETAITAKHSLEVNKELQEIDDEIVSGPMNALPKREAWLYDNPAALSSVKRGLREKPKHKLPDMGRERIK